eukprot:6194517-Pleurochrysis_carterae.AAC.2
MAALSSAWWTGFWLRRTRWLSVGNRLGQCLASAVAVAGGPLGSACVAASDNVGGSLGSEKRLPFHKLPSYISH